MNRILVNSSQVGETHIEIIDKNDLKHLIKVMRKRIGDAIEISDGVSFEYKCEIDFIERDLIRAKIIDKQGFSGEPLIQISLFQGIPKGSKMDGIVQKAVEIGAVSIIPVFMDRTVVEQKKSIENKLTRWEKISGEAVKQCKRGIIPQIERPITSRELEKHLKGFELIIMPYEDEKSTSLKDVLQGLKEKPKNIAVIIGPEGGISAHEAETIRSIGGKSCTLGKTILRTETAGLTAMSMIMYEFEL